jgi:hypothetical protein
MTGSIVPARFELGLGYLFQRAVAALLLNWSSHDSEFSLILVIVTVKFPVWKTKQQEPYTCNGGAEVSYPIQSLWVDSPLLAAKKPNCNPNLRLGSRTIIPSSCGGLIDWGGGLFDILQKHRIEKHSSATFFGTGSATFHQCLFLIVGWCFLLTDILISLVLDIKMSVSIDVQVSAILESGVEIVIVLHDGEVSRRKDEKKRYLFFFAYQRETKVDISISQNKDIRTSRNLDIFICRHLDIFIEKNQDN